VLFSVYIKQFLLMNGSHLSGSHLSILRMKDLRMLMHTYDMTHSYVSVDMSVRIPQNPKSFRKRRSLEFYEPLAP